MKAYLDLLDHLLENGVVRDDRTGTGTLGCFGYQMRFDLSKGFPVTTTKKLHLRSIIHELLWFIQGDTNIKYLKDNGVRIWDDWAMRMEISVQFMVISGVHGLIRMALLQTRSQRSSTPSSTIRIQDVM